ncbi:M48 family metalloprotease [Catellatospora tritici]|uniref:M48 family metalloprotease n=1 Tax=Catellatospora tritici TaxID=2851566 RepID=UPI001C2D31E9|nr:M48 family metalloprotease [Catellatospora tritici]MBV1855698.1 M48 family metalloprotease [Catellatospora tritici]
MKRSGGGRGTRVGLSSTTLWFLVLMAALSTAAMAAGDVWQTPEQGLEALTQSTCPQSIAAAIFDERYNPLPELYPTAPMSFHGTDRFTAADWAEYDHRVRTQCPASQAWPPGAQSAIALAVLFGGASVVYWLLPTWRIRRRGLVRLDRAGQPAELVQTVEQLAEAAGVAVRYLVNPLDERVGGVAFGHAGRRYIELKSGLLLLHRRDRPAFVAVVEHELGHVRHRDLDVSYLAVGLWRAAGAMLAIAAVWYRENLGDADEPLPPTVRYLILMLLAAYLARNGVLRTREYHADDYAARTPEGAAAIVRLLGGGTARQWPTWLAAVHPSGRDRAAVVAGRLGPPEFGRAGAAAFGLLAALAVPMLVDRGSWILQYWGFQQHVVTWGELTLRPAYAPLALLVLAPIGAGLAVAAWRAVAHGPLGPALRGLGWLAVSFGAGLLVGDQLAPRPSLLAPRDLAASLGLPGNTIELPLVGAGIVVALAVAALSWRSALNGSDSAVPAWAFAGYGAVSVVAGMAYGLGLDPVLRRVWWLAAGCLAAFVLLGLVRAARRRLVD